MQLKFRAWDKILQCFYRGSMDLSYGKDGEISIFAGDRFVLMQSTNLRDKNNKQIWEGDWLKVKYADQVGVDREAIGLLTIGSMGPELEFDSKTVMLVEFYTDDPDDFEVLGNCWEQPDLLQGETK